MSLQHISDYTGGLGCFILCPWKTLWTLSSMPLLVSGESFHVVYSDRGHAWFSCWKNLSRLPSHVWQVTYNHEKSLTSHFREFRCCSPLDTLNTRVPNSGNLSWWIALTSLIVLEDSILLVHYRPSTKHSLACIHLHKHAKECTCTAVQTFTSFYHQDATACLQ